MKGHCTLWKNHHKAALVLLSSNANPSQAESGLVVSLDNCAALCTSALDLGMGGSSWMAVGATLVANPYLWKGRLRCGGERWALSHFQRAPQVVAGPAEPLCSCPG